MKIKTIPLLKSDTYLDCGTIEGYEKALIYTFLNESIFSKKNKLLVIKVTPAEAGISPNQQVSSHKHSSSN